MVFDLLYQLLRTAIGLHLCSNAVVGKPTFLLHQSSCVTVLVKILFIYRYLVVYLFPTQFLNRYVLVFFVRDQFDIVELASSITEKNSYHAKPLFEKLLVE